MSAYKQFLTSDVVVVPFEVHKEFTLNIQTTSSLIAVATPGGGKVNVPVTYSYFGDSFPGLKVDRFLGKNITSYLFHPDSDPKTGMLGTGLGTLNEGPQYQRLVYNSIKELYYTNYLQSVYGDPVSRPILIPGRDEEGNRFIGSSSNQAYDNYLQTTLTYPRFFPTASDSTIGVISIPNEIFGDYIKPTSVYVSFVSGSTRFTFTDDGEGNLIMSNSFYGTSSAIVGNVIYPHGIITLTGNETLYSYFNSFGTGSSSGSLYSSSIYGTFYVYGDVPNPANIIEYFVTSSDFTCSFSSSYIIHETQYKCTIRENEFNFTLNPSTIQNDTSGSAYDYVTGSYFSPYITTVGLYDDQQNLLAIGKLAQPLPSSPTTDTTILINIDR